MWFEMSWVDPRIAICPCGKRGESRIHVEHEEDLWLPDLHIMEAKQVNNIKGLTTDRENIQVTFKDSMQPVVVYSLNFRAVLDCHIDTFQSRNKCPVRFGSYVYDNTKVVFQQNSQFLDDKIVNSKYYLELLQLDKKAKEVRFQLKKNQVQEDPVFAYDGFEIIFEEKTTSTQITASTPDGSSPPMSFFRVCIVGIMFCFAYNCIRVMLTFDGLIMGIFLHSIVFGLSVASLCAFMEWLSYHFWAIWDQ